MLCSITTEAVTEIAAALSAAERAYVTAAPRAPSAAIRTAAALGIPTAPKEKALWPKSGIGDKKEQRLATRLILNTGGSTKRVPEESRAATEPKKGIGIGCVFTLPDGGAG